MQPQLKAAIYAAGMTQKGLAKRVGISELDLSRIVTGRKVPAPPLRSRIAAALGRSEGDLFKPMEEEVTA
ncbi:MAG: XRE family transcriptional regulator [Candidatus Latescibacteria bacterium]|nr:XRE family transcriptional regulator [Candidatus Latescibacterota bacterium]